jgi:hypothetical protein
MPYIRKLTKKKCYVALKPKVSAEHFVFQVLGCKAEGDVKNPLLLTLKAIFTKGEEKITVTRWNHSNK